MNTKIDELNIKLENLLADLVWRLNREDLFNLGVELGRELERNKIDIYRSPIWERLNDATARNKKIKELSNKIEEHIATLLRQSVIKHIEENGSWTISKDNHYLLDRFDEEIIKQFNIQVIGCTMERYGGEFTLTFSVEKKLAKLFKKFNINELFTVRIENRSGEEDQTLYEPGDVKRHIKNVMLDIRDGNEWTLEKCDECLQEISHHFLFALIKNS
jgi:hypothetical protein